MSCGNLPLSCVSLSEADLPVLVSFVWSYKEIVHSALLAFHMLIKRLKRRYIPSHFLILVQTYNVDKVFFFIWEFLHIHKTVRNWSGENSYWCRQERLHHLSVKERDLPKARSTQKCRYKKTCLKYALNKNKPARRLSKKKPEKNTPEMPKSS